MFNETAFTDDAYKALGCVVAVVALISTIGFASTFVHPKSIAVALHLKTAQQVKDQEQKKMEQAGLNNSMLQTAIWDYTTENNLDVIFSFSNAFCEPAKPNKFDVWRCTEDLHISHNIKGTYRLTSGDYNHTALYKYFPEQGKPELWRLVSEESKYKIIKDKGLRL